MGHGLTEFDKSVFVKEPAWHGLGLVLPNNISPVEAVQRTMDWQVGEHEVFRLNPETGKYEPVRGFKLLRREDLPQSADVALFDIVKDSFTVIQNHELPEIIETVMGETGAVVETAGTLKVGRRVWILCKCNTTDTIGGDQLHRYFLLHNSHDSTGALDLMVTPIRVVCWNTLSAALSGAEKGEGLRFRHTANVRERIEMVRGVLKNGDSEWRSWLNKMQYLASQSVSPDFENAFVDFLFPLDEKKRQTRMQNVRSSFLKIMRNPIGASDATRGTAFGLFNAVTEYIETARTVRVTGLQDDEEPTERDRQEARMNSVFFGSGSQMRQRAFDVLVDPEISRLFQGNKVDAGKAFEKILVESN